MPDGPDVREFSLDYKPMPESKLPYPRSHLIRALEGVTIYHIRTPEDRAKYLAFLKQETNARHAAVMKALDAENMDQYSAAFTDYVSVGGMVLNLVQTGDKSRPEEDGVHEAGWSLYQVKERFLPESFNVRVNEEELLGHCQRARVLTKLRDALLSFLDALDESLAAEQRYIAPLVREAHRKLEPEYNTNWTLRLWAAPLIEYATGAAKLAAETARKNRRLIEETRTNLVGKLTSVFTGGATPEAAKPAPAPTPGTEPPSPPPVRTGRGG